MLHNQKPRPLCAECKTQPARSNGTSVRGFQLWHKYCGTCAKQRYSNKQKAGRDNTCDDCGFKGDPCQFDQTTVLGQSCLLCANCHRLRIKHENQIKRKHRELTVDATIVDLDYRL
jgi:hypothetical protein